MSGRGAISVEIFERLLVEDESPEQHVLIPGALFYAVRDKNGHYYRTYRRLSRRAGWERDYRNASVYTRSGPARSLVTRLKKSGVEALLVEFVVNEIRTLV